MRQRLRVLLVGEQLRAAAQVLELEPVDRDPELVLVDLRDASARVAASNAPAGVPRVVVAGDEERWICGALGIDPTRIAPCADPHVLGPLVAAAIPPRTRTATRLVTVTAPRGGTGRTLLAVNLARRLAKRMAVCAIDLTGTGALAWWLGATARPWSDLEALRDELSADHLSLIASEGADRVRVVGGPPEAPTPAAASATIRAALALDDLVIVDAPLLSEPSLRAANPDRTLVVAYDDPVSLATLGATDLDGAWLVASQSRADRLGEREVFRSLPRDEAAVAAALARRSRVGGALGRSYDELADLIAIDAA